MVRKLLCLILALLLFAFAGTACADSVSRMRYVFLDWAGEYTGQLDSGGIPFGYGIFISETVMDGELWHYIGSWENGLPEGEGAIYFEDGNMRKGTFSQGVLISGMIYTATGLAAVPITIERTVSDSEVKYIGNKKSLRFHYPTCRSLSQMSEKNKVEFFGREEAIELHYIPCGECNP